MAGEAKTEKFMLGTATVMIGPMADLFDLNPKEHSIGLVKNFTMTSEPGYTDLTQGVKNTTVYSIMTSNPVRATMEVYEHTMRNLAYSLGLNGGGYNVDPAASTTTSADIAADPAGVSVVPVVATTSFAAGKWIAVKPTGESDNVIVAEVESLDATAKTITIKQKITVAVPTGSKVEAMEIVGVGSKENQPYLAAKVVGELANGDVVALLIPKMRVTAGFTLSFRTDNFGNLPFTMTLYDLVNSDIFFDTFKPYGQAMLAAAAKATT
ncbi:hypothetical protein PJWF_00018 [Achromobacter phage JWF]|uniref:hypothetical protein n=1 Tax=Achromobacter phage JWF TaxID=1589748 RepID=UPI000588E563|nr:hypothetical protein AXJ13_gp018 [Achromobacter phage JWF]AJD82912.1 hypothetical protein PJWF_00018 [Achromobacter phage JWF]